MHKKLVLILMLITGTTYSQIIENEINANYNLVPSEETDFSRSSIAHEVKLLSDKFNIENNLELNYHHLSYPIESISNAARLEEFYQFSNQSTLGYSFSKSWSAEIDVALSIASNFNGALLNESVLINGGFALSHDFGTKELPAYINLGLGYYTFLGKPTVLPRIYFYKKFSRKFSLGLGFPKTELNYSLNKNNSLKANMEFKGMYASLNSSYNGQSLSHLAWSTSATGIEFQHKVDKRWSFNFEVGYEFNDEYSFKNSNETEVFQANNNQSVFFGTGVMFNFNN